MRYNLTLDDLATGATADALVTMMTLIVPDTAGSRCRIRSIQIGPSDDAPADANVSVRLKRIADFSVGTAGTPGSTVTGANVPKMDTNAPDSIVTAGRAYSAEPTTYETEALWQLDLNTRGAFGKEWAPEDAPVAGRDQVFGLLAAPRAAAAVKLSGTIEFEVF